MTRFRIEPYGEAHLDGDIRVTMAQGWPSLAEDPERAHRLLTAPGVTTVVALEGSEVVGMAEVLGDGALQGHLALLAVDEAHRRRGIGRALVEEVTARSGVERIDLLAEEGSEAFYESFPHRAVQGYRVYPGGARGVSP